MDRTGHTGAPTISPEPRDRLSPLALVLVGLALSRVATAQISTDGGVNQAFMLPGIDNLTPKSPPYTYGIDAGVGETDNVALTPSNKVSQTIAIADADFTVNRQTRLFDAKAVGDFSYLDYLQNAYGNQLLGRFDGTADAAIVPGRLTWTARDDFGQSALDPYTPVTPNNIENINYFTTGPELKLRLGGVNFVDASLRYGRTQYQTSPFNSNRAFGSVALGRDISAGASISLNATSERVMFTDTAVNGDFTITSAFGRYELQGARTNVVGELGVSTVDESSVGSAALPVPIIRFGSSPAQPGAGFATLPIQAEPGGSLTGPLVKLQVSRLVSPSSHVIFTAGQVLTDPASSFSTQGVGATGVYTTTLGEVTGGIYRDTYASAGWQYQRNRTTLAVTGRWERQVYPGLSSLDVTMPGIQANLQRRLSRALSVQLTGSWLKTHYPNTVLAPETLGSTQYANATFGGAVVWRHGRGLEVRLRLDHESYSVSNGNTGYQESRVFLTVGYRPANAPPPEDSIQ